ncbi:recombinase family protein [Kitasatospora sp. NPDC092286]|uniref:recombinase family protein n=1 Tax=Kitasatospora sp. NPDC092286 TaxID=3364087 RepID=UPI0038148FE0
MADVLVSEYDGCGKCVIGTLRLSRKTDKTNSPAKQRGQILSRVAAVGAHVIAWAEDLEVSGATDPMTRPGLGPWLRGELGPYSGIAAATVDRVGRNVRDTLNTQDMLTRQDRIIITADHDGIWDFGDPAQENEWIMKAWGSQMELRAIQKRNKDESERARRAGQPKQAPSYGYRYVRLHPNGPIDHVEIDPIAAEIIRGVAQRILSDETGKITWSTEAARLTRAGVASPRDRRAEMYGKPIKGARWTPDSLRVILTSEAALGYLMHSGRPVIGSNGRPVKLADPLWDSATRNALLAKAGSPKKGRAPSGVHLLSSRITCGTCTEAIRAFGPAGPSGDYGCTGRLRGLPGSADCRPAPFIMRSILDSAVETWFLSRFGEGQVMERRFDPGTGYAAQIKTLQDDRKRLRDDRNAGLYDEPDDEEWYRTEYARMGQEIRRLKELPDRPPAMRLMPTGRTIGDDWRAASDNAARREILIEYGVSVTLFPQKASNRYVITASVSPFAATDLDPGSDHA